MSIRNHLPYSVKLWLLQRRQRKIEAEHEAKIAKVKAGGFIKTDPELLRAAEYEAWIDDLEFDGEVMEIQTRHLIRQTGKYVLPYPAESDWQKPEGPFFFTILRAKHSLVFVVLCGQRKMSGGIAGKSG
jgi:hypothetical protein